MIKQARALTRQMERLIETALMPGRFISYNAGFSFVRDLEAVERRLSKCLSANPPQAVGLCETFLAGCYEKAGEIDDSSGSFGDFVGQLHCVWIKARQAAGADADETATRLLAWMEADPYGFCHDLEKNAAQALLLETKELERLADLVRRSVDETLESLSHYATEPAAKRLEKSSPDVAARLWCAQGMRIVDAKRSKYYDAALSNFERARRCFERAGLVDEWQRVVQKVRLDHHRKGAFMAGFEEIVAGSGPSRRPSFLQRARARWT